MIEVKDLISGNQGYYGHYNHYFFDKIFTHIEVPFALNLTRHFRPFLPLVSTPSYCYSMDAAGYNEPYR